MKLNPLFTLTLRLMRWVLRTHLNFVMKLSITMSGMVMRLSPRKHWITTGRGRTISQSENHTSGT